MIRYGREAKTRSALSVVIPAATARARRLRIAPVVEFHDLRVRLKPVGDLVLGREDRPVVREPQVGQVVVPDRVMQAERLVAAAPLVAGPAAIRAVLGALRAARAAGLLMALELVHGGKQRPAETVAQAQVPAAPAGRGLELDPGLDHAAGVGRFLAVGDLPVARLDLRQRLAEHAGDRGASFEGLDVPGKRDEVAPVAVR